MNGRAKQTQKSIIRYGFLKYVYLLVCLLNTNGSDFERIFLPISSDRKSEQAKASETAWIAVENETKKQAH
jgi:hypothetical protein